MINELERREEPRNVGVWASFAIVTGLLLVSSVAVGFALDKVLR